MLCRERAWRVRQIEQPARPLLCRMREDGGGRNGSKPKAKQSDDGDEGGLLVSQHGKVAGRKFLFALWMVGSNSGS